MHIRIRSCRMHMHLHDINNSIMNRGLRTPLLRLRRQLRVRGRGIRWRSAPSRGILNLLIRCGFCPLSEFKFMMLELFFCVYCDIPFSDSDDWCDVIFIFIILGWVNGHWSGTRNPVRIRWWVFKAASLLTGAWSCGVKTSHRGGSSPPGNWNLCRICYIVIVNMWLVECIGSELGSDLWLQVLEYFVYIIRLYLVCEFRYILKVRQVHRVS